MPVPIFVAAALAAAAATTSAVMTVRQNKALARAGSAEAKMLALKHIDDRMQRSQSFARQRGSMMVAGGSSGTSAAGSASRTLASQIARSAGDATLDVGVLRDQTKYRMEELRARIRSQQKHAGLEALSAGMQGFMMGMSLGAPSGAPTPGDLPAPTAPGTSFMIPAG